MKLLCLMDAGQFAAVCVEVRHALSSTTVGSARGALVGVALMTKIAAESGIPKEHVRNMVDCAFDAVDDAA